MRALTALIALAALAACGSKDTKKAGSSFAQVLPGSASDAMLPYDTASSAPPLEPPSFDAPDGSSDGEANSPSGSGRPKPDETAPEPDGT